MKPVATGSDRALRRRPPCWEAGQVVMKQKILVKKFQNFLSTSEKIFMEITTGFWTTLYVLQNACRLETLVTHWWFNPSTHRVHKTWTFLIITHNSWYRSRKIKEDSSTEREKFPLQFEPIFITVQCTSRSQDFSNEKWSRNLQIGNAFNDWNSIIFMQIGNVWPKNHIIFFYFLL